MAPAVLRAINDSLALFGNGVRVEEIAAHGAVDELDVWTALEAWEREGLVENRGEAGWFSLVPGLGAKPLLLASRAA